VWAATAPSRRLTRSSGLCQKAGLVWACWCAALTARAGRLRLFYGKSTAVYAARELDNTPFETLHDEMFMELVRAPSRGP
jgi:hypothetical protein